MGKNKVIKISSILVVVITAIVCTAIIIIHNNKGNNTNQDTEQISNEQPTDKKAITEKSDNYMGMRFTFNVSEFEEVYINTLKENFSDYQELVKNKLADTSFTLSTQQLMDSYAYEFNQKCYGTSGEIQKYSSIYVEQESTTNDKLLAIQVSALADGITSQEVLKLSWDNVAYAFMAVDNTLTYEKAYSMMLDLKQSSTHYKSNNDLTYVYKALSNGDFDVFEILPLNEEQYNLLLQKQGGGIADNTDNEDYPDYHRTQDWYDEQERLYGDSSSNNSNSNSSKNNSSNTNNSNSNSKPTTNSNDRTMVYLNINLKELINKNELAKEIKEKYPTIFIDVVAKGPEQKNSWDTFTDSERYEYFGGGASIPDKVEMVMEIIEYDINQIKTGGLEVEIWMNNTSTAIVETCIFKGKVTITGAGTYEIK